MDGNDVLTGAAWREFCERMATLGERVLEDGFPGGGPGSGSHDERDRAEGVRHLANQMACWLTYQLGSTDPRHPALFTHNNLVYRWGGPNVDQNARRATVAGDGVYRLTVSMNMCEKFILQIKPGNMHMGVKGVLAEVSSDDLGIGPGDSAEIVLHPEGADPATLPAGHRIALHESATLLHVRDYYYDWQAGQPAMFALERLDTQGEPKAPLSAERVAGMLDEAAAMIENSVTYWRDWVEETATAQPPNTFSAPDFVEGGVKDIVYAFSDVRLADDEALVVRVRPGQSAQWNAQLQSVGWFESLDVAGRTTCVNHRSAHGAADGTVAVVVSAKDPGVPNWLDTEGRSRVFCTHRWVGPHERPDVEAVVVPLKDVAAHVPAGTPAVTPGQRRDELAARARHAAWRYRA